MITRQAYQITNILMILDAIFLILTVNAAYTIGIELGSGSIVISWFDFNVSVLYSRPIFPNI